MTKRWMGWGLALILWSTGAYSEAKPADWVRVTSPHFVIYSEVEADRIRRLAWELELFREVALAATGLSPVAVPDKPVIYVAKSRGQLKKLGNTDSNKWASLYQYGFGGERASYVRGYGDDDYSRSVLLDSYVVELLTMNSRVLYPAWYVRGLAEYLSEVDINDERIRYGLPVKDNLAQLRHSDWQPYMALMNRSGDRSQYSFLDTFEAQSWLAVHFFMSDDRRKQLLLKYLAVFNDTGNPEVAFDTTFAEAFGSLDRELERYFRKGRYWYGEFTIKPGTDYPIEVTQLSAAAVPLVWGRAYLLSGNLSGCRSAFKKRLQHVPGDARGLAGLALCRALAGDFDFLASVTLPEEAGEQARLWLARAYMLQASAREADGDSYTEPLEKLQALVNSVLRHNKQSPQAIAMAAKMLEWHGQPAKAAQLYDAAAVYAPYDAALIYEEARMRVRLGERERARALLERYRLYRPESWETDELKTLREKVGLGDA